MNIQLTDDYVMTSDAHNFILNKVAVAKTGKHAGQPRLKSVAFYPSIEQLMDGLITLELRQSDARTLEGLIQDHTALIVEIKKLFKSGITKKDQLTGAD